MNFHKPPWLASLALGKQKNKTGNKPTLLHYRKEFANETSRVHLRIDEDGSGLLLVNANQVIHLNPTATFMAHLFLDDTPIDFAVEKIYKQFKVDPEDAYNDYAQLTIQLQELIRPDGACAIHDLTLDIIPPFSSQPSAPYRMDLALTYRCNNDCAHCYNARPRSFPEKDTSYWKKILERVWDIGIPHVVFTGGEPTLREDLPELIRYAEQLGIITGLNTNGRRLNDCKYLNELVCAGLDHVQITLESHNPLIHNQIVRSNNAWKQTVSGIKNALATSSLYVMTNTTLLQSNSPLLEETLNFLAEIGVKTVGLNALIHSGRGKLVGTGLDENELEPLLKIARHFTQKNNQKLIWYTPTQYCNFDPMSLELGVKGCTAALYNMCVEPDGGVLPCQSYYHQLGNLLTDSWDSIWNHDLSIFIRERKYVPEKCNSCLLLAECGGGCPLLYEETIDQELFSRTSIIR